MARRWRRGIGAQAEGMGRGEWSEWRVTKPRDERGARTHRLAKAQRVTLQRNSVSEHRLTATWTALRWSRAPT